MYVIRRVFFTKLKSCIPLAAPKRTKKKIGKKSHFSIVRLSLLVGIRIGGGGGDGGHIFNYTTKNGRENHCK